jgi:hypothetical protein
VPRALAASASTRCSASLHSGHSRRVGRAGGGGIEVAGTGHRAVNQA